MDDAAIECSELQRFDPSEIIIASDCFDQFFTHLPPGISVHASDFLIFIFGAETTYPTHSHIEPRHDAMTRIFIQNPAARFSDRSLPAKHSLSQELPFRHNALSTDRFFRPQPHYSRRVFPNNTSRSGRSRPRS